jgi:hypothetical protein
MGTNPFCLFYIYVVPKAPLVIKNPPPNSTKSIKIYNLTDVRRVIVRVGLLNGFCVLTMDEVIRRDLNQSPYVWGALSGT